MPSGSSSARSTPHQRAVQRRRARSRSPSAAPAPASARRSCGRRGEARDRLVHRRERRRLTACVRRSRPCRRVHRVSTSVANSCSRAAYGRVVERQDVGVREPQRHHAPQPRHRRVIAEARIADARDPLVVVVDRVVDAVRTVEASCRRSERRGSSGTPCSRSRCPAGCSRARAPALRQRAALRRARHARSPRAIDCRDPGSRTSRAASATSRFSDGTADGVNTGPDAALSTLRYATARARSSSAYCSPHSVDEVSVNSSASQLASTIVRFGRKPSRTSAPRLRASSISVADPLDGSTPPNTHASRWLPRMTSCSGCCDPRIRPMTVWICRTSLSMRTAHAHRARRCRRRGTRSAAPPRQVRRRLGPAERLEDHPRVPLRQRHADDLRDARPRRRARSASRRAPTPSPASADRRARGSRTGCRRAGCGSRAPTGPSGYVFPFANPSSAGSE